VPCTSRPPTAGSGRLGGLGIWMGFMDLGLGR
jgi:hypothetical protein